MAYDDDLEAASEWRPETGEPRYVGETAAERQARLEAEEATRAEIALLRRERALLIDLEKARAAIIGGLLHQGAVHASVIDGVARLNAAIVALHQEARGGLVLPEGAPGRCVLCEPRKEE